MFTDEQLANMVPDPVSMKKLKQYLTSLQISIVDRDKEIKKLQSILSDYDAGFVKVAKENKKLLRLIKSANPERWILDENGTSYLADWEAKMIKLLNSLEKRD